MVTSTHDQSGGLLHEAIDLVRSLAKAHRGDFETLKNRAASLVERLDEDKAKRTIGQRHRMAPDRAADKWILDILQSTESAIPREQLLRDFLERYQNERHVRNDSTHQGPWLFVFERGLTDEGGVIVHAIHSAGVHPNAFATLCAEYLPGAEQDPFIQSVLFESADLDGFHAPWFNGSPLFDRLLDVGRRCRGESDYWVTAVTLPGAREHATCGVFALHPNIGTLEDPVPPPNMKQDQRLLVVLSLAWRQLEHQIKALANISESDRREMIQLLAPGLLHHEIGAEMNALYDQASGLYGQLRAWAIAYPEQTALHAAALQAHSMGSHALRLFSITNAFNNLDKRGQVEATTLGDVGRSVALLVHHRICRAPSIDLWLDPALDAEAVHTDAVLLTQALLNVVNNAINAIAEAHTPAPRQIRMVCLPGNSRQAGVAVYNNGPAVPIELKTDIFKRGYTTRRIGHGQGLYLARLVSTYLEGEIQLAERSSLPVGFKTGFRLTLLRALPAEQGLAHAAT